MDEGFKRIDVRRVRTYSLRERKSKVNRKNFAIPPCSHKSFSDFITSLPSLLAVQDFRQLVEDTFTAYCTGKTVLAYIGAHVIKCGLNPVIVSLMKQGIFNAIALNGAGTIHDFELALMGTTSEDVESALADGSFGMAKETGQLMNEAIVDGAKSGLGMGKSLGRKLCEMGVPYLDTSILAAGYKTKIPVVVHVAIGTDIIHQHPEADGEAIGKTSLSDFHMLVGIVSKLGSGGVVINFGSAVLFPEVFLKALNLARNLGNEVKDFTTADFDMIRHYRPDQNVVKRPVREGGTGFHFTGHHEIMIPLFAWALVDRIETGCTGNKNK